MASRGRNGLRKRRNTGQSPVAPVINDVLSAGVGTLLQNIRRIVFVCTGNTCRSPMAMAIFRQMAEASGLEMEVVSAGVHAVPGAPASPGALRAAAQRDLDLTPHQANNLHQLDLQPNDLILTMTRQQRDALLSLFPKLTDRVHVLREFVNAGSRSDVVDPFGGGDQEYEACFAELAELVGKLIDKLRN